MAIDVLRIVESYKIMVNKVISVGFRAGQSLKSRSWQNKIEMIGDRA